MDEKYLLSEVSNGNITEAKEIIKNKYGGVLPLEISLNILIALYKNVPENVSLDDLSELLNSCCKNLTCMSERETEKFMVVVYYFTKYFLSKECPQNATPLCDFITEYCIKKNFQSNIYRSYANIIYNQLSNKKFPGDILCNFVVFFLRLQIFFCDKKHMKNFFLDVSTYCKLLKLPHVKPTQRDKSCCEILDLIIHTEINLNLNSGPVESNRENLPPNLKNATPNLKNATPNHKNVNSKCEIQNLAVDSNLRGETAVFGQKLLGTVFESFLAVLEVLTSSLNNSDDSSEVRENVQNSVRKVLEKMREYFSEAGKKSGRSTDAFLYCINILHPLLELVTKDIIEYKSGDEVTLKSCRKDVEKIAGGNFRPTYVVDTCGFIGKMLRILTDFHQKSKNLWVEKICPLLHAELVKIFEVIGRFLANTEANCCPECSVKTNLHQAVLLTNCASELIDTWFRLSVKCPLKLHQSAEKCIEACCEFIEQMRRGKCQKFVTVWRIVGVRLYNISVVLYKNNEYELAKVYLHVFCRTILQVECNKSEKTGTENGGGERCQNNAREFIESKNQNGSSLCFDNALGVSLNFYATLCTALKQPEESMQFLCLIMLLCPPAQKRKAFFAWMQHKLDDSNLKSQTVKDILEREQEIKSVFPSYRYSEVNISRLLMDELEFYAENWSSKIPIIVVCNEICAVTTDIAVRSRSFVLSWDKAILAPDETYQKNLHATINLLEVRSYLTHVLKNSDPVEELKCDNSPAAILKNGAGSTHVRNDTAAMLKNDSQPSAILENGGSTDELTKKFKNLALKSSDKSTKASDSVNSPKNSESSDFLCLSVLYFVQYQCKMREIINKNLQDMNDAYISVKNEPVQPYDEPVNLNDKCDVVPAYYNLKIDNLVHLFLLLEKCVQCWKEVVETASCRGFNSELLALINQLNILHIVKYVAHEFRVQYLEVQMLQTWALLKKLAELLNDTVEILTGISFILEYADCRTETAQNLMKEAEELLPLVDKSVLAQLEVFITYYINKSSGCHKSNMIKEGLEALTIAEETFKEHKSQEMKIVESRIFHIKTYYLLIACESKMAPHGENSLCTVQKSFLTIAEMYKTNCGKCPYLLALLLEISLFNGYFYKWLRLPRESRCYTKEALCLAQKYALPIRTGQFLSLLAFVDLIHIQFQESEVKLIGLTKILCYSQEKNLLPAYNSKKSPVETATLELSPCGLIESVRDVPIVRRPNLKTLQGSPKFSRREFAPPDFLGHAKNCACLKCGSVEYQKVVLEAFHLEALLGSFQSSSVEDFRIAEKYFFSCMTLFEKARERFGNFSPTVLKLPDGQKLPVHLYKSVSTTYCNFLLDYSRFLTRKMALKSAGENLDKISQLIHEERHLNNYLWQEVLLQKIIVLGADLVNPSSVDTSSGFSSSDLLQPLRPELKKTPDSKMSQTKVTITLSPCEAKPKTVIKKIAFDLWEDEENEERVKTPPAPHFTLNTPAKTPAASKYKVKIYTPTTVKPLRVSKFSSPTKSPSFKTPNLKRTDRIPTGSKSEAKILNKRVDERMKLLAEKLKREKDQAEKHLQQEFENIFSNTEKIPERKEALKKAQKESGEKNPQGKNKNLLQESENILSEFEKIPEPKDALIKVQKISGKKPPKNPQGKASSKVCKSLLEDLNEITTSVDKLTLTTSKKGRNVKREMGETGASTAKGGKAAEKSAKKYKKIIVMSTSSSDISPEEPLVRRSARNKK